MLVELCAINASYNCNVVDAASRSLGMIYESKLGPKYDFFAENCLERLLSLLASENENVTLLGATYIIFSCVTTAEQNRLWISGVLEKLSRLLDGSPRQQRASLMSLATVIEKNTDAASKFANLYNGKALRTVTLLMTNRDPMTRLLACLFLTFVTNSYSSHRLTTEIKTKLVNILLNLLDDSGQVAVKASLVFWMLENEDMQKLAFEANAIEKFHQVLQQHPLHPWQKHPLHPKLLEGVFLALAGLCSKLECCRASVISLKKKRLT